jgi:IS5 family transposase
MKIKEMSKDQRIYSWHAPEVECTGKGKVHNPFEFGDKVSIITNLNPAPRDHFVLSSQEDSAW